MFTLVIRFSGMCLFTPRSPKDDGQYVTDVSLLRSGSSGAYIHDPQLSIVEGAPPEQPLPIELNGYDITICDGTVPLSTPLKTPHKFAGAIPLGLVLESGDIRDGILVDGKAKPKFCAARLRLFDGKISSYANTGDRWHLVEHSASGSVVGPISPSPRIITTEFAYTHEIKNSFATLKLENPNPKLNQSVRVQPTARAKHATVSIANPDRTGVAERRKGEINRSADFEMVFAILKPGSNYTPCYFEQVNAEPIRTQSIRKTLHIPCVGGCTTCKG